jgi:hydrogenase-4 component B
MTVSAGVPLALFFILCALGAAIALVVPAKRAPITISAFGSVGALALFLFAASAMFGPPLQVKLWTLFPLGMLEIKADTLSAMFVLISAVVFLPVSVFSSRYLEKYSETYNLRYFCILYFTLLASIALILIAADAVLFLIAWEIMSVASYLLVAFEDEHEESARAGYVMLAMSEAGAIAVIAAFVLLAKPDGGLDFVALKSNAQSVSDPIRWTVFLLSFFGFAVKAGLVPFNSWLPLAHPVAPTNVSALLSAVIVNLGIYGIVRINLDIAPLNNVVPGLIVLVVGSASALIGILYATVQEELKRLLAHSTIENMGIVTAGIGASMIFLSDGHAVVAGVALIAALYHMINHSVYKALLFIGTGALEAGTGTRDLDKLGGVIQRMPWTSAFFLVGVLSISALPPLNGFVSEWLTLQTILRSELLSSTGIKVLFAVSGAALALTAGLAVTCFAKVFAMGFLGMPRSNGAANAMEVSLFGRVPLAWLSICCLLLGVLPTYVIPVLDQVTAPLAHQSATGALVPPFFDPSEQQQEKIPAAFIQDFHNLGAQIGANVLPGRGLVILHRGGINNPVVFAMSTSYMALALVGILLLVLGAFWFISRTRQSSVGPVWAGGLGRLVPEITYTATGFSNPVRVIFDSILNPGSGEDNVEAVARHFRTAIVRRYSLVPVVDRWVLAPPVAVLRVVADLIRRIHVGHVNAYAAYVLIVMLTVLLIGSVLR